MRDKITIETLVHVPVKVAWETWTLPEHIVRWNSASEDWHTTKATNDLRVGGTFSSRMEAKDGSMGFDFFGVYDVVKAYEAIEYTLGDERKVWIHFQEENGSTKIREVFEAEGENKLELQRDGWQAILNHYKNYTETLK